VQKKQVAFSLKRCPNKLALGCALGSLFPDLALNATTKFWKDIFCKEIKPPENINDLKETETKIIYMIAAIFYKIQPIIIATAIGYFIYPAVTKIFPIAIGARLAANGLRSDFFLKLTNQDQKTKSRRRLSL